MIKGFKNHSTDIQYITYRMFPSYLQKIRNLKADQFELVLGLEVSAMYNLQILITPRHPYRLVLELLTLYTLVYTPTN